jgi:hypothetical protein
MDEQAFRQRLASLAQRCCPFAKAILSDCVACSQSDRVQIAERELVVCETEASHSRCEELHELMRHGFGFSIGVLDDAAPIPHAHEMRIQCGGLKGLSRVKRGTEAVDDVDGLLRQVAPNTDALQGLPLSAVVHAARECYKGRRG